MESNNIVKILHTADGQCKNREINLYKSYENSLNAIQQQLIETKAEIYVYAGDIFEYDTIILKWKYEKILKNNIISKSYISDFYPPKDFYYKLPMFMNLSIYLKGSCDHTTINIYNKIDTKNNIHTTILNLFIDVAFVKLYIKPITLSLILLKSYI